MSYETERKKFNKRHFNYIEVEVGANTYRFCDIDVNPMPVGFEGSPTLLNLAVAPVQINITGGFGLRSSASVSVAEAPTYTDFGASITSPKRFWACWRAANPYYKNERISIFSGYIPENIFDISNFIQRDYIIDTFAWAKDGVNISLVDPLKLANNDNAKLPIESNGSLLAAITDTTLTATLSPAGIGDDEYPVATLADPATHYYIASNDELIKVTDRAADVLTIVRAQFNTVAQEHELGDKMQVCEYFNQKSPSDVQYRLFNNPSLDLTAYITKEQWDAESSASFPNVYSAIIAEPTGIKELSEDFMQTAPYYTYYDERTNKIIFKALTPPVSTGDALTYQGNLLQGRVGVADNQDMRVSTVTIYFGIFNPLKDLDETTNYRKVYQREDSDSVSNNGSKAYKTIFSRWISDTSKTAAVLTAARIGRRLAIAPKTITYELDPKDADVWAGDSVNIITDLILEDVTFEPANLQYQVISAKEDMKKSTFKYTALEHTYGDAVADDDDVEDPGVRLVYISGKHDQLKNDSGTARTLRDMYDGEHPGDLEDEYDIRFIFEPSCVAGSSDNTLHSIVTGSFPGTLTLPVMLDIRGLILGKGGFGADVGGIAELGGPAISLGADVRINNTGTIGGGGDGGGDAADFGTNHSFAAGGGGAGYYIGTGGTGSYTEDPSGAVTSAQNGTNAIGGDGASSRSTVGAEPTFAVGLSGNDLGDGQAIALNGYTISYVDGNGDTVPAGTILGAIS